jgi:hypothetical protein
MCETHNDRARPFALGGPSLAAGEGAAELAAFEFDPAQDIDHVHAAFSGERWADTIRGVGIDARLAAMTLKRTKSELVAGARKLLSGVDEPAAYWELSDRYAQHTKPPNLPGHDRGRSNVFRISRWL